ncbi:hypothetical protein MMC11_007980 [Xylographa trunciseda]|nr:hypothetical protein [Xylographa trunciseda]
MFDHVNILCYSLLFPSLVLGLVAQNTLPPKFSLQLNGNGSDSTFPHVYRDGGVSGMVSGKNLMVFCDTTTTTGDVSAPIIGFTSNSIAYYLGNNPTPQYQDFGNNGIPNLAVPWLESESSYTAENFDKNGNRVVIWPGSSITAINGGNTGIAVWGVAIWGPAGKSLYNTLVTVTVNETGPHIERTVPKFIQVTYPSHLTLPTHHAKTPQANDTQYGNFGSTLGASGHLLLLAVSAGGLKLARVDPNDFADLTKYEYYLGPSPGPNTWSRTPPPSTSPAANLFTVGPAFAAAASGDVFWSPRHRTFLAVYFSGRPDSTFYLRYALHGCVAGPWSAETVLYVTAPPASDPADPFNYAGHAHPSWDAGGETLGLSWSFGGAWVQGATVSWV